MAEPTVTQKTIQALASLAFLAVFVVAGLEHRAGNNLGPALGWLGEAFVALGFALVGLVFRTNTFTSAVVAVEEEQLLVATGPYAVVRHPMYSGALLLLCGVSLALGALWAFVPVGLLVCVIAARSIDEEKLLSAELAGYPAYLKRVRWRLLPGIW
jgi:protein-S-isoprenylcysteine O-methyltransferase Ste14